jgi:hypothetical protein
MKNDNYQKSATIDNFCNLLENENPQLIDFDSLRQVLREAGDMAGGQQHYRGELEILRKEYQNRIIGMLKAGLAGRHNDEDLNLANALIENPERFTATELVEIYGRTAAKFRSRFPASLKYLSYRTTSATNKNWKEHKI